MTLAIEDSLVAAFLHKPVTFQIMSAAKQIATGLPSLQAAVAQFASSSRLLPADCDKTVQQIRTLAEPVSRLEQFLKQQDILPPALAAQRFDLLASLRFVETKSQETARGIARYRLICLDWDSRSTQQRMAIQHHLEMLVKVGEDLSNKIQTLLEASPSFTT
jgi:hypothetical protein